MGDGNGVEVVREIFQDTGTYSEKAHVAILFEGLRKKDFENLSGDQLNIEGSTYKIVEEKRGILKRSTRVLLIYFPEMEITREKFNRKLENVINNIGQTLKKGFRLSLIHI